MSKITFRNRNNKILNISPTKLIVLSFAILIFIGAILLSLPVASKSGVASGFLDSLFTATSATCVTGLVVVDTYQHWTLFGQIVILALIQTGGLGIITMATFFSSILGRKVGLRGMLLAQESIGNFSFEGILRLIKKVILITFLIEFLGALILSLSFVPKFGLRGIYFGFFHSISAFCNAGFDLMGSTDPNGFVSLINFNNDPLVIYTISALIIIGGLGFVVWKDLFEYKKNRKIMLHTKAVLIISGCLIVFGFLFFFTFEFANPQTLGKLNFFEKINAAFFQSVTPRTAGFNSIDQGKMSEISKLVTTLLMFIGAAPGSTGGGIKVTTFGVIIIAVFCQIRGYQQNIFFKNKIHHSTIEKALSIAVLSGALIIIMTAVLLTVEKSTLINVLYEATSAFGTVGLSTGITPTLHPISKTLLVFLMFLGRVGPLSFIVALSMRDKHRTENVIYPEGKIIVG